MCRVCIVLPCCKSKDGVGNVDDAHNDNICRGTQIENNERLVEARQEIDAHIDHCSDPVPAVRLYSGRMYPEEIRDSLANALRNHKIDIVYFSGGYGLVHATTLIRRYECEMTRQIYNTWLENELDSITADYFSQLSPAYIIGFFPRTPLYYNLFCNTANMLGNNNELHMYLFTVANGNMGRTPAILRHKIIKTIESTGIANNGFNDVDINSVGRFLDNHEHEDEDGVRVISIDANNWEEQ